MAMYSPYYSGNSYRVMIYGISLFFFFPYKGFGGNYPWMIDCAESIWVMGDG